MSQSLNDHRAIEAVIQRLPEAWNKRDPQLFASAFSEPHDYVAVGGHLVLAQTRSANAQAHAWLWQTRYAEGSTIRFEILAIAGPLPGLALAIVKNYNDFITSGRPGKHESILSLTLLQAEEGWYIRQFNNNIIQG